MEDRNSDGNGGFLQPRTVLGHFIILNNVVAPNGGEIVWNQLINTPGVASMEDAVNFYQSSGGSPLLPIAMHDSYLQGMFASGQTRVYTGNGVITDGAPNDAPVKVTAYISIFNNSVVQTQNGGIALVADHDNLVTNNRIVSCGKDAMGNWIAGTNYGDALGLWNSNGTNLSTTTSFPGLRVATSSETVSRTQSSQIAGCLRSQSH